MCGCYCHIPPVVWEGLVRTFCVSILLLPWLVWAELFPSPCLKPWGPFVHGLHIALHSFFVSLSIQGYRVGCSCIRFLPFPSLRFVTSPPQKKKKHSIICFIIMPLQQHLVRPPQRRFYGPVGERLHISDQTTTTSVTWQMAHRATPSSRARGFLRGEGALRIPREPWHQQPPRWC